MSKGNVEQGGGGTAGLERIFKSGKFHPEITPICPGSTSAAPLGHAGRISSEECC